tara:strand:- start:90 stop:584 length:495 start_codon:yes stop_codon:yes gene_type:complete
MTRPTAIPEDKPTDDDYVMMSDDDFVEKTAFDILDEYRDFMNHNLKYSAYNFGKEFDDAMKLHLMEFYDAVKVKCCCEVIDKLTNSLNALRIMERQAEGRKSADGWVKTKDIFADIFNRWLWVCVLEGAEITYEEYYNCFFEFKDDIEPPPNPSPKKRSRKNKH